MSISIVRSTRKRLAIYLIIALMVMGNTILHMFIEVRPFDWLMLAIEAVVVILILYEIITEHLRRKADAKRKKVVDDKVLVLSEFLDKGRRMHKMVPDAPLVVDQPRVQRWVAEVHLWVEETNVFLALDSEKASRDFMQTIDSDKVDSYIISSGRGFHLRGESENCYRRLSVHLDNLRRIIHSPESYF